MLAASTHPRRVSDLVLVNTFARLGVAPDYPAGAPQDVLDSWVQATGEQWRGLAGFAVNAPSAQHDDELAALFTRFLRLSVSPGEAVAIRRVLHAIDVRAVLGSIQAPTLVLHRRADAMVRPDNGRYLAEHIPHARFVEVPGEDHLFYLGDTEPILAEIEESLTGGRHDEPTRVLATVLFTDIVRSTELAARLGDRRWRELLDEHDEVVGQLVQRFQGRLIKVTGDGVLATFDGPGRAVRCAVAVRDTVGKLGIEVRAGLHTGEIELRGDDITGLAVVIARRLCDLGGSGDVQVSRTVTDLVIGSGITFVEVGTSPLKGVPGEWPLFRVVDA
jgi:class 3 adenylate cyclase